MLAEQKKTVYVESVEEVSVVEESVGEEEMEEHDEQVENFAEDEPAKIYIVPRNRIFFDLQQFQFSDELQEYINRLSIIWDMFFEAL